MKKRGAAALLLCLSAGPAAATGSIYCSAHDDAGVEMIVGSLPVLFVESATVEVGETVWSTRDGGGERISVGQRFEDGETIRVDFTDQNVERVLIELRLFKASEGSDTATGGTLRIADVGVWPVACSGP